MLADNNHRLLYFTNIFDSIKQKMDRLKKTNKANTKWTDYVSFKGKASMSLNQIWFSLMEKGKKNKIKRETRKSSTLFLGCLVRANNKKK